MGSAPLSDLVDRLAAGTASLVELRPRIEADEPWPLAAIYGAEPEASWGPRELLAHLTEMFPYWLGEIERVLEGPADGPAPFGRVQTDDMRIGVIGRDRTVPLRELYARLEADSRRVAARLRELDAGEADRVGRHRRGDMTIREIVERMIVGHLEGHVEQLRQILAAEPAART